MKFALILTSVVALTDARLLLREIQGPSPGPSPAPALDPHLMADSDTIEGPDCGHVKQIIGKWAKAKKAGGLAGAARGTVNAGTSAERLIMQKMLPSSEAIGNEIGDEMPASIKGLVDAAKDKVREMTSATTELEGKLINFKNKLEETDFAAKNIGSEDMATLKKKTTKAKAAIKDAYAAAERAVSKAKEARENAMQNNAQALKIVESVMKKGKSAMDDAKDIKTKANNAISEADETMGQSQEVENKVREAGSDAGDQQPVFEALASNIADRNSTVQLFKDSLSNAIGSMDNVSAALGDEVDSFKTAVDERDASNAQNDVPKAEGEIDKMVLAINSVKGNAKTLLERTNRLKEIMKEAEKKVA